jgi:hypothetical protein
MCLQIQLPPEDQASQIEDMVALRGLDYGKPRTQYADFTKTKSGIQYKDVKVKLQPFALRHVITVGSATAHQVLHGCTYQ